MQKRSVTGKVYWADGQLATAQMVIFDLEHGTVIGTDLVLPRTVSVTTNHLGIFTAELWCSEEGEPDLLWKATFPTGEVVRFVLPYATGATVQLTSLLPTPAPSLVPVDNGTWGRLKTAAITYSRHRPLLVYEDFEPTAAQKAQTPTEAAIGIESIVYGEEFTFSEVMSAAADSADQGWCFYNGVLYLTPAPADATTIPVVWRRQHQPDEQSRTFPTIPPEDRPILDLLAAADEAEEEQAAVESGLTSYTIGGTTVKWGQQGGATTTGTTRAQRLRQRALALLDGPMAQWG
jgi:hypothetical protein